MTKINYGPILFFTIILPGWKNDYTYPPVNEIDYEKRTTTNYQGWRITLCPEQVMCSNFSFDLTQTHMITARLPHLNLDLNKQGSGMRVMPTPDHRSSDLVTFVGTGKDRDPDILRYCYPGRSLGEMNFFTLGKG